MSAADNDNGDDRDGVDPDLAAIARKVRHAFRGIPPAKAELDPIELARDERDWIGPKE